MKDFINPYNDKMVSKIEIWLKDLCFVEPCIIDRYNEWLDVLDGDTREAEHMTCTDLISKTCDHILNMTWYDEYDRYYTIKQFHKMYHEAIKNVVRDTIIKNS